MTDRTRNRLALVSAVLIGAAAAPSFAGACCPSGGNGALVPKAATTGLEQTAPATANVSGDPSWAVYQFTRGGVNYTRVDDAYGRVRAVVGNIGSTAWALPMGIDADRVLVPGDIIPSGVRKSLLKSSTIEVVAIETSAGPYWFISPVETTGY